ncbi:MAG: response regulator transcription factor [Armatimonadetes bacterium]|nr:response regulator transcription factor [Armatimonadota bacterium]
MKPSAKRERGISVLVVDDEPALRRLLKTYLADFGHEVAEAESGETLGPAVRKYRPQVVVLDVSLPGIDGVEALRLLREWSSVPVVMLSVRDAIEEKIRALDAGADDYVTKPFSPDELEARIRVAVRRKDRALPSEQLVIGDIKIDPDARQVFCRDKEVALTPTEWELLRFLAANPDRVVTYRTLLTEVWGTTHHSNFHVIRVTMSNLRRKLGGVGCASHHIKTEQGVGYRLISREQR